MRLKLFDNELVARPKVLLDFFLYERYMRVDDSGLVVVMVWVIRSSGVSIR